MENLTLGLYTAIFGAIVTYFLYYLVTKLAASLRHLNKIMKLPGSAPSSRLWGHAIELPGPGEAGLKYLMWRMEDCKAPLLRIQFGPITGAVGLCHYTSVRHILKSSEPKPKILGYAFAYPWLGDGLLLSNGDKWRRSRRLLTPAFHFDILKPYMRINNDSTDEFLEKLNKMDGQYFELFEQISLLTLDVILKCAFSYNSDCQNIGSSHPYVKAVREMSEAIIKRMNQPWLYPEIIFNLSSLGRQFKRNCNYVHTVANSIIEERKKAFKEHGDSILRHHKYIDFLDILLKARDEDGKGLTDLEIRNQVDTFLFEGHDTTASSICWTLYSLAEHPEIQSRCQQEVDELYNSKDHETFEWDDLNKLSYLTMCIKEALRIHAPVPIINRITTKDMDLEGYHIPANTLIDINFYIMNHNEEMWKDSFKFLPERFSTENTNKMDPYQFVPFSAGPRNCIGQNFAMHEMKVVLAKILRRFTIELDPQRPAKHEMCLVMKTEDGMYVKAVPRSF